MTPHVRATSTAVTIAVAFHQDAGPPRSVVGSPSVIGQPLHKAVIVGWQRIEFPLIYVEAVVRDSRVIFSISYRSDAGGYGRIVNQDLIIRRYLPSDEDVVVDLWSNAAREAHPFLVGEGTGDREQKMREVYLIQADNWVAEHNSEVVGLLGMIGSEIGGLFVAPASQGLGVGRALVEHATR